MEVMHARIFMSTTLVAIILVVPLVGFAAVPEPFVYNVGIVNMPTIPGIYGAYQSALRAGDTPIIRAYVHSKYGIPTISADLSAFGLSSSATTTGAFAGYSAKYPSAYYYDFHKFSIGADVMDGLYDVPITAIDSIGGVSTTTVQIRVDNTSPTFSLSGIDFSSDSVKQYDTVYVSGLADGTGSVMRAARIDEVWINPDGKTFSSGYASSIANKNLETFNASLATSTDGTFTRAPVELYVVSNNADTLIEGARAIKITVTAYDGGGHIVTSTITVTLPHPPPPDPCIAAGNCVSNVMFLPGIEGSRLYEGTGADCGTPADEKLWEPYESLGKALWGAGDAKVKDLFLKATGESSCSDIYVKEGDIIDSVGGGNIYASLVDQMNGLKTDGTIRDWEPVAYDWRLSLDELLNYGAERDGKIYYEEATSTPYIEQTLRALAKNSKTGKVTIVAHSNGGLVAKALLNQLGSEASKLVDKIIMVGAPQSGAPEALGVTLVGHNAGIYSYGVSIVSNAAARELAQNSPMAYHLLPSQQYFDSVMDDSAHPVARFAGDGYPKEISAYGSVIGTLTELDDFLLAKDGGREKPKASDLSSTEVLNSTLVDYANGVHNTLDGWTPPAGIEVNQIAGWGVDTVAGIDFYTSKAVSALTAFEPVREYRPIFTEDGDGTVPVPSALMMASNTSVKRYWVNLDSYRKDSSFKRDHSNLFEVPSLRDFIKNLITNSTSTLPAYISATQPAPLVGSKKLTFYLHSPLTLEITDSSSGNVTGLASDNSVIQDIPGSTYGEFGEVKYVTVPEGSEYHLTLHGQSSGTFSLDIQESSGGVITASSTIANVPTTASTLVSLTISDGLDTVSALTVDENGDGKNVVTITPKVGETVNYEPPAPTPAPQTRSTGSGGRHISIPSIIPILVATSTSTSSQPSPEATAGTAPQAIEVAPAITQPVGIYTPVMATTKPLQAKKKASVLITPSEKVNTNVSQTASVYEASKQSVLQKLGAIVYNGLQGFWTALKKFF